MAKERSASEKAMIEKAQAFNAAQGGGDWNQERHALFIAKLAKEAGLQGEGLAAFHAQLSMLGIGGNASQFAQAAGFRKAGESTSDEARKAALAAL